VRLGLFLDVVEGAVALQAVGRPLPSFADDALTVQFCSGGGPARWQLRVGVQASAAVPAGAAGGQERVEAVVACWQMGDPEGALRLVVEAAMPPPPGLGVGDPVMVTPVTGGAALEAVVERLEPHRLLASALVAAGSPFAAWDGRQFAAWLVRHGQRPNTEALGLGRLLARTLLVHGAQPLDVVLPLLASGAGEPTNARLAATQLLHRAADRATPAIAAQLPGEVWRRVLALIARLLRSGPTLSEVAAEVQALRARLEVELFFGSACEAAIAAACGTAQAAPVAAPIGAPMAATAGFRLVLQRDGETTPHELHYEVDRVTIGRRDGENLLRLADPMVSSTHAVIERSPDGFVVFDRGSTNGTEVDGIRLPVEVEQPLRDGSVIVIKPFRLEFRLGSGVTSSSGPSAPELHEQLCTAFAEQLTASAADRTRALDAVLQQAARELPPAAFAGRLAALAGASVEPAAMPTAAARAFEQLSRSLLGGEAPTTAEQVQAFAGRLGRFVEAASRGIERLLELKRALGKHLQLDLAATTSSHAPVRTAAEVRALALGWSDGAPPADASAWYLAKFFDDLAQILVGLLQGNVRARTAVRDRLDPQRLLALAAHDERLRPQVQAAAKSALWKFYEHAFGELTAGGEADQALQALLERARSAAG
jgi:predicted component of type VI protein secretion system